MKKRQRNSNPLTGEVQLVTNGQIELTSNYDDNVISLRVKYGGSLNPTDYCNHLVLFGRIIQ